MEPQMTGKTSLGLEANIEAVVSYSLGPITGLVIFIAEKESKFVRFHAFQSIVVFGAFMVVQMALGILLSTFAMMRAGFIISFLALIMNGVSLVALGLWVILMIKAYQGEKFKLPVAGDMAEKNA